MTLWSFLFVVAMFFAVIGASIVIGAVVDGARRERYESFARSRAAANQRGMYGPTGLASHVDKQNRSPHPGAEGAGVETQKEYSR